MIAKKISKILKPKIFISQQSLNQYAIIADALNTLKIPSLLITHGSHIINSDDIAKKEWRNHSLTFFDALLITQLFNLQQLITFIQVKI